MKMNINGVRIRDTFSEGFSMVGAGVLITAENDHWARIAAEQAAGFATSVIGCGCEAAVQGPVSATPDLRPGYRVLFFSTGLKVLEDQLLRRIGNCVMTCPTTSCFNGLDSEYTMDVGAKLRYFGDGWQSSKRIGERRYWRVPVMEGEFLLEESYGYTQEGATGNFLILAEGPGAALEAAQKAVHAIRSVPDVIMPFPGGIVRSGSKVGSKYSFLKASTFDAYCPTLRCSVETELPEGVNSVLEIVICGLCLDRVKEALHIGIDTACIPGVLEISAGNYGGTLGNCQIGLHELMRQR